MSRQRNKNNGILKKFTIALCVVVVALAVAIGVVQQGSVLSGFFTPDKVEGLTADVCFADVHLKWKGVKKAKGYRVYEQTENGEPETVGFTKGETEFVIDDYEKDSKHQYHVAAYNNDIFNSNEYEGEASDPVEAYYDSSKYAQKIPVLAYHNVIPPDMTSTHSININAGKFEEQMKWLHDNGYRTLTLDEYYMWHKGKKEFPKKTCLITFDDGEYGIYHFAYPILKKYDQAATSFVIGHHIADTTPDYDPNNEETQHVGWDVISRLRKEYPKLEFESHTFNMHKKINGKKPVTVFTYDQMIDDIKKNERFGFRYLAYPWGTYNETMQKALSDSGYKMAFGYTPYYYSQRDDDIYAVNRVKISGKISLDNFIKTVSGENEKYDNPNE